MVKIADELGFRNILCPSSYQVGQDTLTFASAIAPMTKRINLLPAIRCGEIHPPMLAKSIATLDHILRGRLTLNIISSDLAGTKTSSKDRYARSREVISILKQAWNSDEINFKGKFYNINLALVTKDEHPNHFAIVDRSIVKEKNIQYHRDGIGYIYETDPNGNFIELLDQES